MTFAPRRIAALAALITMLAASLATAGVAMAASSTITAQDCEQGTIRDQSTGQPIPQERCEALIGKNVALANTGLDLRPVIGIGVLLLVGAGVLTLRSRRSAPQLT